VIEANAGDERDAAGDSFDLAAELADALDGDSSSASSTGSLASANEQEVFSAVFSEFKKGVDKALGDGDHEARYDLGIAYREMGLLDDAVREFQAASTSPERRLDCLQMLGLCAIDMGRAEEGTAHLQQALDTPELSQEQTLGLRFELGRAFEVLADFDRAREAWEAVAAVDPSFCEVEERLASLRQAKPEPDAVDLESFDDLFDDEDTGSVDAGASPGESFDDLVDEASADDAAPDDAAIDDAEDTDDLGSDAVAPEPADAAEDKKPRRRKKKISFV
jgi:tetratricopeptide (TPR) repeat protein